MFYFSKNVISVLLTICTITNFIDAKVYINELFDNKKSMENWKGSNHSNFRSKMELLYPSYDEKNETIPMLSTNSHFTRYAHSLKVHQKMNGNGLHFEFILRNENPRLDCAGGYITVLETPFDQLSFGGTKHYKFQFGPTFCKDDDEVRFVIPCFDENTQQWVEHRLVAHIKSRLDENVTHLYTLIIKQNEDFSIKVDDDLEFEGNLRDEGIFEPPLVYPRFIPDTTDTKPDDWDDRITIDDPTDVPPPEWDDSIKPTIDDPSFPKPKDWIEEEPIITEDKKAKKPAMWDSTEDGEYRPRIGLNEKCVQTMESGCGKWKAPQLKNPKYKGKYPARQIPNPNYKGEWKPKMIPNPEWKDVKEIIRWKNEEGESAENEKNNKSEGNENDGNGVITGVMIDIYAGDTTVMFDGILLCDHDLDENGKDKDKDDYAAKQQNRIRWNQRLHYEEIVKRMSNAQKLRVSRNKAFVEMKARWRRYFRYKEGTATWLVKGEWRLVVRWIGLWMQQYLFDAFSPSTLIFMGIAIVFGVVFTIVGCCLLSNELEKKKISSTDRNMEQIPTETKKKHEDNNDEELKKLKEDNKKDTLDKKQKKRKDGEFATTCTSEDQIQHSIHLDSHKEIDQQIPKKRKLKNKRQ
ncbi:putative calnexin [Monocercomonoides exilis]|uniref:putative calnexin n=1 Tax=Monocercomonoides exilis TaxID=2049356 RepID=UPI00355A5DC2|nr:putative calnexin [Monocercomonoides exilis]